MSGQTTSGHTATPWEFLEEGRTEETYNVCKPLTICGGPNRDDLANIYSSDDSSISVSREEARANAAFIVKAVNNHEALVEALMNVRAYLQGEEDAHDFAEISEIIDEAIEAVTP